MGLNHDRGTDGSCDGTESDNYGYRDPARGFRTIMAYDCKTETIQCNNPINNISCTRIQRFSTPLYEYKNKPLGIALGNKGAADNARVLILARETVSNFYQRPTLFPSDAPSPSPTDSSHCINNSEFTFPMNGRTRGCEWITRNRKRRSRRRIACNQNDVAQNCKLACNRCAASCEDSSTFTFVPNNTIIRDCAWLTRSYPRRTARRLKYYCEREYSGTLVRDACKKSCVNCDA